MAVEWIENRVAPHHEAMLGGVFVGMVVPRSVVVDKSGETVVRWHASITPLLRTSLPMDVRWRADEWPKTLFETIEEAKAAVEGLAEAWAETCRYMVRDHGLTASERRTLWRLATQGFTAQIGSGDCNLLEGFAAREIPVESIAVRPVELDENDQPVPDGYARYRITGYGEKLLGVS